MQICSDWMSIQICWNTTFPTNNLCNLFSEPTQFEEVPRSIESQPASQAHDYSTDYTLPHDYHDAPHVKITDYDAFDYVNGDFDKVDTQKKVVEPSVGPARPSPKPRGPQGPPRTSTRTTPKPVRGDGLRGQVSVSGLGVLETTTPYFERKLRYVKNWDYHYTYLYIELNAS